MQELVDIACAAANEQIDGFTTRLADALVSASKLRADPGEAKKFSSAAQILRQNRYPFFYVVSARLRASLEHEIHAAGQVFPMPGDSSSALKSLPPPIETDKDLCLAKTSAALNSEHAERLTALGMRLSHLLERDALPVEQNPFRPRIFLSMVYDAWCEFHPDTEAHPLVFPLLRPELCLDMGPILHVLNTTMIKRGILPDMEKKSDPATPCPVEQAMIDNGEPSDPVARQLRRLFPAKQQAPQYIDHPASDTFPALFQEEAVQATASRNELLSYLASVRKSVFDYRPGADTANAPKATSPLIQFKQQVPQDKLTEADQATIDLLTKIFDVVFRDGNIPADIKTLIGSMQMPVLKTALVDKDFFFKEEHPARRTIELMVKLGVGWDSGKEPSDPLYQAILRNTKRVQHESDWRVSRFAEAVTDLEAFILREEAVVAKVLSQPIAQAVKQEKVQQATKTAKVEVAQRVETGEVVEFVETFLEDKWVSVLARAYDLQEEEPQVMEKAVKTMDDLVWSVKPKITMAERRNLIALLPAMLAEINQWLDMIECGPAERERFFDELAECHASLVRAPLEISPQRQIEIVVEIARQAAERRRQKLARQPPEPAPDQFTDMVQKIERGAWVEFAPKRGAVMKLKLAWISPMQSRYIFSTGEKQEALSMSAEEFAQALREKRARVLAITGMVGRALAEALEGESANSAPMAGKSAA